MMTFAERRRIAGERYGIHQAGALRFKGLILNEDLASLVVGFVDEDSETPLQICGKWWQVLVYATRWTRDEQPCSRPWGPWFVDPAHGTDHAPADGSSLKPFRTVRRANAVAAKNRNIEPQITVRCAPGKCEMLKCPYRRMRSSFQGWCKEHGNGDGWWRGPRWGEFFFLSYSSRGGRRAPCCREADCRVAQSEPGRRARDFFDY